MNAHITEWLAAYYDDELSWIRRQQVEEHLRACPTCQAELEELHKLSKLLQEVPSPEPLLSSQRFQAQVKLRLPPTVLRPGWLRALKAGWQFAPLGAVFVWVFTQAVLLVAGLASALNLPVNLSRAGELSGGLHLASFSLSLGGAETVVELGLLNLVLTALAALFLCGWIASWWVLHRQAQKDTNPLRV
jgi:predicted anti-sigma-YlaC factor YlaD